MVFNIKMKFYKNGKLKIYFCFDNKPFFQLDYEQLSSMFGLFNKHTRISINECVVFAHKNKGVFCRVKLDNMNNVETKE